jgi:drug/metabolite transporter (DMT)-like permease
MLWVLYSLLSAFSWATADAFTKKVNTEVDDYVLLLSRFLFAAPFALLLLFFIAIPKLDLSFWYVLVLWLPIEMSMVALYIKSIRISPLSLVVPFLALTPIFLLLTSFLILGEVPTIQGFFGILFVVVGAYTLNLKDYKNGFLGPVKSIFKEKGVVYMIIVAIMASITTNLGKVLIQKSSALFFSAIYFPVISIPLFLILFLTMKKNLIQLKSNFRNFLPIGLFFSLMVLFHNLAITLTIVPYMISIKRTSSIFSVFYGHFLFKEENIKARFVGAAIMLIGAVLIILS